MWYVCMHTLMRAHAHTHTHTDTHTHTHRHFMHAFTEKHFIVTVSGRDCIDQIGL